MESVVKITRETEFYQGYIRFKMGITNESPYVINDVTLDFIYDENLLHIPKNNRQNNIYPIRNGKFILGNIFGKKSTTFTILFEPLTCSKAADIKCQVNYANYEGIMVSKWMEPKEISVVCPILETAPNINIGSLKYLIEKLPTKDSRVFAIENSFDLKKLETLSREVIEKHDVCHVSTLHTRDGKICEIWYYGTTKVTKDDIVIKVSILFEEQILELFAATQDAKTLTGLLAEAGRELKETVESRISGKGKSINLTIKDSVLQRSNLLDMCKIDGTCDVNVIIEDSVVQRTKIATVDEKPRLRQEQEGIERRKQEEEKRKSQEAARQKATEEAEKKRKEEERRLRAQAEMKKLEEERLRKEQEKKGEKSVSTPVNRRKLMLIPVIVIIMLAAYWFISPLVFENYTFVTKWGSYGSSDGKFAYPSDVAVDSSGNVYVADSSNNRIQKFDGSGNFVTKWGSEGGGDGQFYNIQFSEQEKVTVDSSGNVYVADVGNNRIQKFDSSGNFITKWGSEGNADGQFFQMQDVAVGPSGNIYVADRGNDRIQKFDSSGNFVTKWDASDVYGDGQLQTPVFVAVDVSENVYLVENTFCHIQKFDSNGNFITEWGSNGGGHGQFYTIGDITVDSSGNVYVAEAYRIQKFDSSGNFITEWGSFGSDDGEVQYPTGIAVDSSGNVYVADRDNNRIQKFAINS